MSTYYGKYLSDLLKHSDTISKEMESYQLTVASDECVTVAEGILVGKEYASDWYVRARCLSIVRRQLISVLSVRRVVVASINREGVTLLPDRV